MNKTLQYWQLITHLGPGWVFFRVGYALRRKLGGLRRAAPHCSWSSFSSDGLALATRTAPVPDQIGANCREEAEAILSGRFRLFSHREVEAGFPPDWARNWTTENRGRTAEDVSRKAPEVPRDCGQAGVGGRRSEDRGQLSDVGCRTSKAHWSEIGAFAGGDIKGVWELSRFGWAYALVRAWGKTGDRRFADGFWRLFEDWCEMNPPNAGANWMCGQEAAIRLMAVVFAAEHLPLTESQREMVARFVRVTGRRIAANLDYALSQKNNHGISECAGLITAGLLLPDDVEAGGWLALGLSKLETQCAELVYPDGSFSQHSLVYHRVLLLQLCWAALRLRSAGQSEPAWLIAAGRRATDFLATITDAASGEAPLYGANDGANILPLSACAFTDMRPAVQLGAAVFHGARQYAVGTWDEPAQWLVEGFDQLPLRGVDVPERWHAAEGGLFQLWRGGDRLTMRCSTRFRHRPSQADIGQVDVWLGGARVAIDGGSYSYNSKARFTTLGSAREHNALTLEGREPMRKAMRFLYLPWPRGDAVEVVGGGLRYTPHVWRDLGAIWSRTVQPRAEGGYRVQDRLEGVAGRTVRWHWRLAPGDWVLDGDNCMLSAKVPNATLRWSRVSGLAAKLVEADPQSAAGWESRHYGEVTPACSLVLTARPGSEVEMTFEFHRG